MRRAGISPALLILKAACNTCFYSTVAYQFLNWQAAIVHRTGTQFVKDSFPGCTAPKPPLCKGRWAAERLLGGVANPSVSFADSSLYTREPFLCHR